MKKVFLFLTMLLFVFTGVMRASTVQNDIQQNRTDLVIEQGFEEGLGDWTMNHCHGSSGVSTSYTAHSGSAVFRFYYTTSYPQYLISPELDDNDGVNFTFYAARYSSSYPETFKVGYSSTTNEPTEFTWGSEVTCTTMYGAGAYQEYSYDFPAGTKYVAIACTSNDQFYLFIDDITLTAALPSGGAALTTEPTPLDLGARPNGAWMTPYKFNIKNTGGTVTVNAMDINGSYFTYDAELPALVNASHPLEVTLTTGEAEEGPVNSTMTVLFGGNRDAQQFNVTAYAYDPVEGDVWENAINVTNLPYSDNAPAGIYKNYDLPVATEGAEAMYKLAFNDDVLLSAGTNGANRVSALYPEGFNGEGGPMADNNYTYAGPTINPGPMSMWFSYSYTGSNTFFGTSAGGGMIFGYRITPAMLQELGLGNCAITTVEAAAREGSYYDLMLLKGGDTPDVNNMVYYQSFEDYTPLYFFDLNLDEPQFLGDDENIWVMFYSDSPYAAYCGIQPVDAANSKIWYTTDLSTWYSNTTYTPVIYTRFLELPTGREVTVNLADMKIRESKPAAGQIAEAYGDVMGVAKAQMAQNNRGNRANVDVTFNMEDSWGDGWNGSAGIQVNVNGMDSDFVTLASGSEGTEVISVPEGAHVTLTWVAGSYDSECSFEVVMGGETLYTSGTLSAGLLFEFDVPATGAVYQISEMFVPAGTYYLAVASTTDNFPVDIMVEDVPAPEQAVIYYPYDGETNVEAPYLAEWGLGDYTVEMQVLVGTQYPPQTALIDWTDYLVESAFITNLEPNQSYFMQVNARNGAGTTYGEIIAFTTPIDPVEGFAVADDELYPGDAAVFTWTANNRTLKGYNLYQDGVKINPTLITETTYTVEGLEYNMDGYDFQVTAVYDAGESALSDVVTVYMTGFGSVSGHVYDIDVEHPIAGATIVAMGVDEHVNTQTFTLTTDETGLYEGEILAGIYAIGIISEGYANEGVAIVVNYNELTEVDDIITHEFYYPLGMITATEEESDVLVEWAWAPAEVIVDFETGDFSQAEFTLPETYPWAVTTTNPHEGTYCMKSTCEGVASGISAIELTAEVPYDGLMGFWVRVSTEATYDKFHFYIDGVEMGSALSGNLAYQYKEFPVTEGTHTYKFEYAKDSSVNSNDDCVYVDDITLFKQAGPAPSGNFYDFDNSTMQGWTTIDGNNDGYDWVLGSEIGGIYLVSGASLAGTGHNDSQDMVCSGSYSNATSAAITPNNFLVSPMKLSAQAGAFINFWACAQDASYAAEHFGVAVSTGSNTNANDFTIVQEWTMTSKNAPEAESYNKVRGTRDQGNWYEKTVDLSAYAGQEIWVAIRHFNCTDMFILNVDDIMLGDGSEAVAPRNDRTFQSFNLYRRNNIVNEVPELIATGLTDFSYVDNAWATLGFGEYQWGIAATYDGYAPTERSRETATFGFENGSLEGWTNLIVNTDGGEWINSDDNLGGYDYTELAHTGTGFAMCYSYVDYVGAYDTDAYFVSPQKYAVDANSSIAFWADNANDDYPENFSVCVSTAETPTAASFTQVWSGGAKGTGNGGAAVRRSDNRYENWRSHEISLAAYAGQEIWIAFHDVNYDMYEIWIDDVTITYAAAPVPPTPPTPTGDGESEILWSNVIEKDMDATITVNVALSNGQFPEGAEVTVVGGDETLTATIEEAATVEFDVRKGAEYTVSATLDGYTSDSEVVFVDENKTVSLTLVEQVIPVEGLYVSPTGFAKWEGQIPGPTPPTPPTPGEGQWYQYGDETIATAIGDEGPFWWAVMFPAGSYEGEMVTKVATYATGYEEFTGNVTIYNDGTSAPATAVGTMDITVPNTTGMVEFEFPTPVAIDATKNLWIVMYNATSTNYVAGANSYSGSNADWVSEDNTTWFTLGDAGLSGYGWILKAYVAQGAKGEVHEITAPTGTPNMAGKLAMAPAGNRAPVSYKVMLDGQYLGETTYPFYQFDVADMEEGSEHVAQVAPLYVSGMGEWMSYTWTYTPCVEFDGTEEFGAEVVTVEDQQQNIVVSWTLPEGANPPGPNPPTGGWTEGFESGMPDGWTVIDANNDGWTWCLTSAIPSTWTYYASMTLDWYRTGSNAICSGSYINGVGALTPNEYLVTSQVTPTNGSTFSFYAAATDASYPADHFGVAVSTTGTSASDFTMLNEWTLTAKEGAVAGGRESRDGDGAKLGTWYQYSVDLSSYAGQNIYLAIRHFNCNDQYIMCVDDLEFTAATKGDRAMWDLVYSFQGTSGYQYGVATDGTNIYTSSWSESSTSMFYKYDMTGNFVEEFNISGCGQLRGMTYDGDYFYGVANSSTVYCVDLANKSLVSTFTTTYGAMRCITYDPVRDGFWVVGNWSGNLTLIDRTGAIVQTASAPTSASDIAYFKDDNDIEHIIYLKNESGNGEVYEYNITTNTMGTSPVYNCLNTTGGAAAWTGSSGGCFVGTYDGKTCLFADAQQSPQLINIYELSASAPVPPTPPTPSDIYGAILYRGEDFIGIFDANTTSYTDENMAPGTYSYTIRVIHGGDPDVTYFAMSCPETIDVTVHHLAIAENEVVNSIYPNPTSGDLNINAEAMTHVTVFNAMGQMVYDQDVNADSMVLNMGQYESGVYMVRIDTENGSSVKRITVVK